jgi:hypothetical protein
MITTLETAARDDSLTHVYFELAGCSNDLHEYFDSQEQPGVFEQADFSSWEGALSSLDLLTILATIAEMNHTATITPDNLEGQDCFICTVDPE